MQGHGRLTHATASSNLADILSRVLDAGLVIAGDIKIKIVDIELLSIQIRLVIASVDKAREMGLDWWRMTPDLCPNCRQKRVRVCSSGTSRKKGRIDHASHIPGLGTQKDRSQPRLELAAPARKPARAGAPGDRRAAGTADASDG